MKIDRISSIEIQTKEDEVIRKNKMQRHDLTRENCSVFIILGKSKFVANYSYAKYKLAYKLSTYR